jgi:hypothetical protein
VCSCARPHRSPGQHHARASPVPPRPAPVFPRENRTENRNSFGYACACARRSSPCAHHTIRLPRPPAHGAGGRSACPRYRDHRSRGTVWSWRLLP